MKRERENKNEICVELCGETMLNRIRNEFIRGNLGV